MPRVVHVEAAGGPEVLRVKDLPLQPPGPGEVRVKVEALGLNRAEVLFRMGFYLEPLSPPSRIGYDAAGVVDAVGSGVGGVKVGDRVATIPSFLMSQYGVYGDYATVPARAVAAYPEKLSPREAAAMFMPYLTAYGALVGRAQMHAGDYVLIPAASSSVGHAAIQVCRREGANPIAATRSHHKKKALLDAGAHQVIVTNEEDLSTEVHKITSGKGVRIVFDPLGGSMLEKAATCAAYGGDVIEYGWLNFPEDTKFPVIAALQKQLTVRGYTLFDFTSDPQRLAPALRYVQDGVCAGTFRPMVDMSSYGLDQIAEAHRYMESNAQNGKIVVTV
jgi:NADPH:quinone reductase-like Zn-dependent oxidoreductase